MALISLALEDESLGGFTALKQIHREAPEVACIMLMDSAALDLIMEALRSGARGIFLRPGGTVEKLRRCIQVVNDGQVWINNADVVHLIEQLATTASVSFLNANGEKLLTKRENEIALLVAGGLTNREIAREKHLSENTVKNHLLRIFDKLGLSNRAELIIRTLNRRDETNNAH